MEKDAIDYEAVRRENIKRNQQLLDQLGVMEASSAFSEAIIPVAEPKKPNKRKRTKKESSPPPPARKSSRLRGISPGDGENGEGSSSPVPVVEIEMDAIVSAEIYFKTHDIDISNAIRVDGHFKGWVESSVAEEHGIKGSATEAWESEGGGKFSFRDPTGGMVGSTTTATGSKRNGWSNIRYVTSLMLKKNPNAYFYRHTAPGLEHKMGEFSDEEHQLFLDTARQYGCGDKWGLFSTYLPHRVGYQDPNYQLTSNGTAVFHS